MTGGLPPVRRSGSGIDPATGVWNEFSGANIALGLPIIRTSVGHGAAFGIAVGAGGGRPLKGDQVYRLLAGKMVA